MQVSNYSVSGIDFGNKDILKQVTLEDTKKWKDTLKQEIINWSDIANQVNNYTDSYINENFENLIDDGAGNAKDLYFIEISNIKKDTYIYNKDTDIVYKIPATRIGSYTVHSVEELDYKRNGGAREKGKKYTKVQYEVELKTVGNETCYEPDLNNFGEEVTSLIFYKKENGKLTEKEYVINVGDWINKGKPNVITENGNIYALYDYENKIWANVRVISGTIETNWTWIPRYAYANNDATTTTSVIFVDENNKTKDGEDLPSDYTIASAFEGNTKKGIWISKYEPSYQQQTDSTFVQHYLPDLAGFDEKNTYIEIYDKEKGEFVSKRKISEIDDIKKFSQENLWFDYSDKIWANIKVEKNGIETWWVWIPRYAYRNDDTTTTTDIIFVDINNKPINGQELSSDYTVASAFQGNTKKGIWISKYEPSEQ